MSETPFLDHPRFRSTDAVPIRMTGTELINLQSVEAHIDKAIRLGRYGGSTDPIAYLIEKQCVVRVEQELYPTLAGILCFGHDPQATFPNAVVDLGMLRTLLRTQPTWRLHDYADAVGRSRSWVKKWVKRLRDAPPDDPAVLQSRSRARKHPPPRLSPQVVERILEIRDQRYYPPDATGSAGRCDL